MEVPPGHKVVTKLSYSYPEGWHGLTRYRINRPWWQFWKPRYVFAATYTEPIGDDPHGEA